MDHSSLCKYLVSTVTHGLGQGEGYHFTIIKTVMVNTQGQR